MRFESQFNIGDDVFIIHDNEIQKGKITKIVFPEPSLIYDNYSDDVISYYIWPQSFGPLPESLGWTCENSIHRYQRDVGSDINDLCNKIKKKLN